MGFFDGWQVGRACLPVFVRQVWGVVGLIWLVERSRCDSRPTLISPDSDIKSGYKKIGWRVSVPLYRCNVWPIYAKMWYQCSSYWFISLARRHVEMLGFLCTFPGWPCDLKKDRFGWRYVRGGCVSSVGTGDEGEPWWCVGWRRGDGCTGKRDGEG